MPRARSGVSHLPCNSLVPFSWRCPLWVLDSTDRRNSLSISLCRCFVAQCLAWPFVELACHDVQLGLRDIGQIGSLEEVLPQ